MLKGFRGLGFRVLGFNGFRVEHWEYTSLNGNPSLTRDQHSGRFGDRYFEPLLPILAFRHLTSRSFRVQVKPGNMVTRHNMFNQILQGNRDLKPAPRT